MHLDIITCNALTTGQSLKHSSNDFWEHACRVGYFRVTFIMCWSGLLWFGFTILDLEKLWLWRNTTIIKCDWRNIFLSKRIAAPVHMQSSSCHFDPKTAAPDELEQPFRTPLDSKVQIRGHITTSMSTLCLFPQADLEICLRCAFSCFCHARAIATQ